MQRRYAILDVFADRPLAGNPLAVVLDSAGLDEARMQAIAREFNLSETVFVLPPGNSVHSAAIRIFTPGTELPFAGHPTVGTAVIVARETLRGATSEDGETDAVIVLEEKVGPVRCGVKLRAGKGHAVFDVPRLPKETGPAGSVEDIAAALGLIPAEIGFENHAPTRYDAGVPFAFVPVRDLRTIGRIVPQPSLFAAAFAGDGNVFAYTRETEGIGHHFHARMFAPGFGLAEDPATGAAVAALPGVIGRFDAMPAGTRRYTIEQGFEMGRPSLIGLEIDTEHGRLAATRISGDAVIVGEGVIDV
jgi:trans-2,3-dihydro-3-hydroxyanthranilate isomerase